MGLPPGCGPGVSLHHHPRKLLPLFLVLTPSSLDQSLPVLGILFPYFGGAILQEPPEECFTEGNFLETLTIWKFLYLHSPQLGIMSPQCCVSMHLLLVRFCYCMWMGSLSSLFMLIWLWLLFASTPLLLATIRKFLFPFKFWNFMKMCFKYKYYLFFFSFIMPGTRQILTIWKVKSLDNKNLPPIIPFLNIPTVVLMC